MSIPLNIKIKSEPGAALPVYATAGSAGMDISAHLEDAITIEPGARALIPTGLYIEIPEGYEAQIRGRSGLAVKHGVTLANAVGTIDSDYRGEIRVALINLGHDPFVINNGDRIAQMIIARYEKAVLQEASVLEESDRGEGGFGHTGR